VFAVALIGKEALPLKPDIESLLGKISAEKSNSKDLIEISDIDLKRINED